MIYGLTLGVILADFISHPTGVARMFWAAEMALTGRCVECGYKLDHPFVKHETPWVGHYGN